MGFDETPQKDVGTDRIQDSPQDALFTHGVSGHHVSAPTWGD